MDVDVHIRVRVTVNPINGKYDHQDLKYMIIYTMQFIIFATTSYDNRVLHVCHLFLWGIQTWVSLSKVVLYRQSK